MGFKIPGPKGAALGKYKPVCEAWVEAFMAGDERTCALVRAKLEGQPDGSERRTALAYLDKKVKTGVTTTAVAPPPVKKTPIDTMRQAVDHLSVSRRPFAEAILEGVKDGKVTELMLAEIKMSCDAAIAGARRHHEFQDLYKIPDSIT